MRKYLLNKKEEIRDLEVKPRNLNFPLTKNFVNSVTGPRRAGKTYSLYNLIKYGGIKDEEYLFINFEDEEIQEKKRSEIMRAVFYHQEIYGKEPKYVFFDEVQNFERWESMIYSLFEKKKYFIFITGSSSKLLSKEIATQLRGRSISTLILPFSFKEIMHIDEQQVNKKFLSNYEESKIMNSLRTYLKEGGFPDIVLTKINRKIYFRDYINLVIFKDVVERYGIKNVALIKMFVNLMLPSYSKEFSIHKIYNAFKSRNIKVSKKSLYKYADALEDSFFCFFLKKFSYSERESLLSIPKLYMNDMGLVNYSLSTKFEDEIGKLMENAVFLELKRREYKGEFSELFYFKDYQQHEVDFVIKEGLEIKQLIQVTYASDRDEIEKREIRSLLKASEVLKCKNLLVITWDYEDEKEIKGKKIGFVPLWKWLLGIK